MKKKTNKNNMKIELMVKWVDRKKLNEDDDISKRVIKGDEEPEPTYTFDPLVLDVEDISGFNKLDNEYTIVRTYYQDAFCVKISYENFKKIYAQLSGQVITEVRQATTPSIDIELD